MIFKKLTALLCTVSMVTVMLAGTCFAAPNRDKRGNETEKKTEAVGEDEEKTEAAEEDEEKTGAAEAKSSKGSDEETGEEEKADWTVLVYVCGTDLESEGAMASYNFGEIAKTYPNDSVNVVIQTGGTRRWHTEELGFELDPKKCNRLTYDEEGFKVVDELPLKNMASSKTLSDFLSWGAKEYPAEKYMLVMWDHGGGSEVGLLVDEFHNEAVMSLPDFEKALDKADVFLESVAVDCCLMASLEMTQALQGHARYLTASEELEPDEGNAWGGWLQYLYDDPGCSGAELGRVICNKTQQKYVELNDDMSSTILTQSVVDISRIPAVNKAFDNYFTALGKIVRDPENYRLYKVYTDLAEHYPDRSSGMVDLVDLADKAKMTGLMDEESIGLHKAVENAVLYCVKGKGRSYSHGLSYFDGTGPKTDFRKLDHYARTSKSAPYLAYLDAVNLSWTAPDWVYEEVDPIGDLEYEDYGVDTELEITEDGRLQLKITDGLDAVTAVDHKLYKMGETGFSELGEGIRVEEKEGDKGIYISEFDGTWPAINGVFSSMSIQDETSRYTRYTTPVFITDVDEEVYIGDYPPELFSENVLQLESAYIPPEESGSPEDYGDDAYYEGSYEIYGFSKGYSASNTSFPDRGAFSLNSMKGIKCCMLYPVRDILTGNMTYEYGEEFDISRTLTMEPAVLPKGEYGYSFTVRDLLGNVTETEIVRVRWDGKKAEFSLPRDESEETEEEEEISERF